MQETRIKKQESRKWGPGVLLKFYWGFDFGVGLRWILEG